MKGTITEHKWSKSGKRQHVRADSISESVVQHRRRLILPEEVKELPLPKKVGRDITEPGEMLLFVAGHPPIKGKQVLYFQNDELQRRARIEAPKQSDTTDPDELDRREREAGSEDALGRGDVVVGGAAATA